MADFQGPRELDPRRVQFREPTLEYLLRYLSAGAQDRSWGMGTLRQGLQEGRENRLRSAAGAGYDWGPELKGIREDRSSFGKMLQDLGVLGEPEVRPLDYDETVAARLGGNLRIQERAEQDQTNFLNRLHQLQAESGAYKTMMDINEQDHNAAQRFGREVGLGEFQFQGPTTGQLRQTQLEAALQNSRNDNARMGLEYGRAEEEAAYRNEERQRALERERLASERDKRVESTAERVARRQEAATRRAERRERLSLKQSRIFRGAQLRREDRAYKMGMGKIDATTQNAELKAALDHITRLSNAIQLKPVKSPEDLRRLDELNRKSSLLTTQMVRNRGLDVGEIPQELTPGDPLSGLGD